MREYFVKKKSQEMSKAPLCHTFATPKNEHVNTSLQISCDSEPVELNN